MPGGIEFEYRFGRPQAQPRHAEQPMKILVLGDFSGRGCRERPDLVERRVIQVDVDNFESVLSRLSPRIAAPTDDSPQTPGALEFASLDDFHPDQLYRRMGVFQALRAVRGRLLDPASFAEAAAGLRQEPVSESPTTATPAEEEPRSTFERLLGGGPGETPPGRRPSPTTSHAVANLIRNIVEPHIVPDIDQQQEQLVASVDAAITEQMRTVLHRADFQSLESVWRGLHRLVTGLETGEELRIFLLDVTREELAADLLAAPQGDLQSSGLHRLLVEQTVEISGGEPWALLAGNYSFGASARDVALLSGLGAVASRAGGPFLAAADPSLLGCGSLVETPDASGWKPLDADATTRWQTLRRSAAARWLGLAIPRVLLRLPYGRHTDAIETFDFEEVSPRHDHERYLWGNPALACAMLTGLAFEENGWSMQIGDRLDIEDLPAHTYHEQGESKMKPCAEVLLGERAGAAILARGIMPLLSHRGRNAARLMRFQSLADPPAGLPMNAV